MHALLFQASHFKGDWHRFNLHQTVKGSGVVTEEEFQHIMEGLCYDVLCRFLSQFYHRSVVV